MLCDILEPYDEVTVRWVRLVSNVLLPDVISNENKSTSFWFFFNSSKLHLEQAETTQNPPHPTVCLSLRQC